MTLNQWRKQAKAQLAGHGSGSAEIDSDLLLAHTLNQDRAYLFIHDTDELTPDQEGIATTLLARRLNDEPVAFILGYKEFYGLRVKTDSRALIPRPESEIMVDTATQWLDHQPDGQIVAEIGTGSGAIILAVAKNCPNHVFYATDISQEALDLAQENAQQINLDETKNKMSSLTGSESAQERGSFSEKKIPDPSIKSRAGSAFSRSGMTERQHDSISFLLGDLGQPLLDTGLQRKVNLLLANLPYIPTDLLVSLDPTITYYEPNIALEGGKTGLELYDVFLTQAKQLLAPGGLLLCEHDYDQGHAMRELADRHFPSATVKTIQDYLHHDRLTTIQL